MASQLNLKTTPNSMASFRSVIIDHDHNQLVVTSQALASFDFIEILAESTSHSMIDSLIEHHKPDHLFIHIDESNVERIKDLRRKHAKLKIIVMGQPTNADLVLRCFRSGADEFLTTPLQHTELLSTLERLRVKDNQNQTVKTHNGRVIGIWGSRGGCGTSTLALNLADLINHSKSAIVVDFHPRQGDLRYFMDIEPAFTLRDIAETYERFDDILIDSVTTQLKSGLHLLLQPNDEPGFHLNASMMTALIEYLQTRYSFVVLDLGCEYENLSHVSVLLDDLYLILKQDMAALFMATQKLQFINESGFDMKHCQIVINTFHPKASLPLKRMAKVLRQPNPITIREDVKNCMNAINRGVLLSDLSKWGKAYKDIKRWSTSLLKTPKPQPESLHQNATLPSLVMAKSALAH